MAPFLNTCIECLLHARSFARSLLGHVIHALHQCLPPTPTIRLVIILAHFTGGKLRQGRFSTLPKATQDLCPDRDGSKASVLASVAALPPTHSPPVGSGPLNRKGTSLGPESHLTGPQVLQSSLKSWRRCNSKTRSNCFPP